MLCGANHRSKKIALVLTTLQHLNSSSLWNKRETHLQFFEQLRENLNLENTLDWYRVKKQDVYKQGGVKLLKQYYDDDLYKVATY